MVIVTNKCSYDRCDIVMHWVFLSSFIRLLKFTFKQFHGQLFSHSDEVAIPDQCTLGYNLVNPLGICNRTGSNSKKNLIRKRICIEMISKIYGRVQVKKNMFIQTIQRCKKLLDYLMKYTFYIIDFDLCWTRQHAINLSISKIKKNALFLLLVKYSIMIKD